MKSDLLLMSMSILGNYVNNIQIYLFPINLPLRLCHDKIYSHRLSSDGYLKKKKLYSLFSFLYLREARNDIILFLFFKIILDQIEGTEDTKSGLVVENSKLEKLRRNEIINCLCGITEEDGLMIQVRWVRLRRV